MKTQMFLDHCSIAGSLLKGISNHEPSRVVFGVPGDELIKYSEFTESWSTGSENDNWPLPVSLTSRMHSTRLIKCTPVNRAR